MTAGFRNCFFAVSIAVIGITYSKAEDTTFELPGLDGKPLNALDVGDKKAVVLFFISPYCPTSNNFGPAMNEIAAEFRGQFTFHFIHSDKGVREQDILQHASMMSIEDPILHDADQALAKHLGATITPETIVLDEEGQVLYRGRINDLYLGPTNRQQEATTHDLKTALTQILSEQKIAVTETEPVGCKISGLK
ncbi:MAG: hypothetical protein CMO55_06225 [Verrucomicrobiales bacterium]|nr:hypothetical protein [Verrucomicrobiales bacterium]